jgi:hypothetical protein
MAAIDDDLWKFRNKLIDQACKEYDKETGLDNICTVIDLGIGVVHNIRELSKNSERIAKAMEEQAAALRDIATHYNHRPYNNN